LPKSLFWAIIYVYFNYSKSKNILMRDDILQTKLEKLDQVREFGMDPYPEKTERDFQNAEVLEKFDEIGSKQIALVGRIRSLRPMGGSAFAHIEDESGKMQLFLNKENIADILTTQYDVVLNGYEIGGGSLRNHRASDLRNTFEIMGYT
jgi:lysyl-tRNA synthetase class 2